MQWIHVKRFEDFTVLDLYGMLKLRQNIFIIEQECIYDDIDNLDLVSEHLLLKDGNEVIGYSRIVPADTKFSQPSIGRIAIHQDFRNQGYGTKIIQKSLDILFEKDTEIVTIEAQTYLQAFYESLGFEKVSDSYPVDGISHIKMKFKYNVD